MTRNEIIKFGFDLSKEVNRTKAEYKAAVKELTKQQQLNDCFIDFSAQNATDIHKCISVEVQTLKAYLDAKKTYRKFISDQKDTFKVVVYCSLK